MLNVVKLQKGSAETEIQINLNGVIAKKELRADFDQLRLD